MTCGAAAEVAGDLSLVVDAEQLVEGRILGVIDRLEGDVHLSSPVVLRLPM